MNNAYRQTGKNEFDTFSSVFSHSNGPSCLYPRIVYRFPFEFIYLSMPLYTPVSGKVLPTCLLTHLSWNRFKRLPQTPLPGPSPFENIHRDVEKQNNRERNSSIFVIFSNLFFTILCEEPPLYRYMSSNVLVFRMC